MDSFVNLFRWEGITLLGIFFSLACVTLSAQAEDSCVSAQCHQAQQATTHPKDGKCESCHARRDMNDTTPHPAHSGKTFTTKAICADCHQYDQPFLHPPVAAGECTACHLAHGSTGTKRLSKPDETLCFQCHFNFIEKEKKHWHIREKDRNACLSCHNAHGNRYRKLLSQPHNETTYVSYDQKASYPLCFSCHKQNMLRFPDTRHYTEFRDGQKNLHYLHVNKKEKGKNCILCHEVHASRQEHLIAEQVTFGSWTMPLNFTWKDTGGSCVPGCHQERSYDTEKSAIGSPEEVSTQEKPKE